MDPRLVQEDEIFGVYVLELAEEGLAALLNVLALSLRCREDFFLA